MLYITIPLIGLVALLLTPESLQTRAEEPTASKLVKSGLPNTYSDRAVRLVNADLLRVGISNQSMTELEYASTRVSGTCGLKVTDQASKKTLLDKPASAAPQINISVNAKGFQISQTMGKSISTVANNVTGPLTVESGYTEACRVSLPGLLRHGKAPNYRGYFEITRGHSSPAKLSVVNILPLQDYLKAVVPNELPARYGLEAIRAQAIAARNYALRPREKFWPQFDICDSQYCQAYYGAQTESIETTKALAETEGLIGIYNGEIALALYSSSHGGYAEAYSNAFSEPRTNVFPAKAIPYLQGGPDIAFDKKQLSPNGDLSTEEAARAFWGTLKPQSPSYDVNSPYYRWEKVWTRPQLESVLNQNLAAVSQDTITKPFITPLFSKNQSVGTLKKISVIRRGVSGKVMSLKIEGSNGTWFLQKEFTIRKVFKHSGRMLPSANIVFSTAQDAAGNLATIKINGGGFGHGVGMSQLGASWMHAHGFGFDEIIQHYYRGVSIGSVPLHVGTTTELANASTDWSKAAAITNSFYVKTPKEARLIVHTDASTTEPVYIKLNQHTLAAKLVAEPGGNRFELKASFPVQSYLLPNSLNHIVLFPDPKSPERPITVWVDVFSAKP